MMEKFPKPKIETGGAGRWEKTVELGSRVLRQELTKFEVSPKRASAFALMTILAMGFAGAGRVEARTRYGPTMGSQVKREVAGQISRGVGEAMTGVDQAYYRKAQEAGQERSDKLTQLHDYEAQLDGDFQRGKINQDKYLRAKGEVRKARALVEKDYHNQVSKIRLRQGMFQFVRRGVRGW